MSVYRYYFPGKSVADVDEAFLRSQGLSERLWDCMGREWDLSLSVNPVNSRGPDGGSGAMLTPVRADGKPLRKHGYNGEEFECHKSHHGDYFIVWDVHEPPRSEGLRRHRVIDGYDEVLGDDDSWICPTAWTCASWNHLPCRYSQLNGEVNADVLPQYETLMQKSQLLSFRLLEEFRDRRVAELVGLEAAMEFGVLALGTNYRVSMEECSLLGVFDDDSLGAIVDAAIDVKWFDDFENSVEKKRLWLSVSDVLRTSLAGLQGETSDTPQAEPISS